MLSLPQLKDQLRDPFFADRENGTQIDRETEVDPSRYPRVWVDNVTFPITIRDGDITAEFIVDSLTTVSVIKDKLRKRFPMFGEEGFAELSYRGRRTEDRDRLGDIGISCGFSFRGQRLPICDWCCPDVLLLGCREGKDLMAQSC